MEDVVSASASLTGWSLAISISSLVVSVVVAIVLFFSLRTNVKSLASSNYLDLSKRINELDDELTREMQQKKHYDEGVDRRLNPLLNCIEDACCLLNRGMFPKFKDETSCLIENHMKGISNHSYFLNYIEKRRLEDKNHYCEIRKFCKDRGISLYNEE